MFIRAMRWVGLLLVVLLLCVHIVSAQTPLRIGIIGDSNSDEYRANDNRAGGTQYALTTLNWVELSQRYRGLDVGSWATRSEPRRTGYAYNCARSGATAVSMISGNQHTCLATQITANLVDYGIIYIGQNDFHTWNGTYAAVYNCTTPCAATQVKIDAIVASITTAVDTLLAAQPDGVVLVNYSDPGTSPDFQASFPDANKRARVTNAINQINTRLDTLAASRGIVLADLADYSAYLLSLVTPQGNLIVGGESISLLVKGDEPHHVQLSDSLGHGGTVINGLLANFIIGQLATGYSLSFAPFSDAEILTNAGIAVIQPTATPTPTSTPTATPTATDTPTPTNTFTPVPTFTFTPTFTPVPTDTPTPNCGV